MMSLLTMKTSSPLLRKGLLLFLGDLVDWEARTVGLLEDMV